MVFFGVSKGPGRVLRGHSSPALRVTRCHGNDLDYRLAVIPPVRKEAAVRLSPVDLPTVVPLIAQGVADDRPVSMS